MKLADYVEFNPRTSIEKGDIIPFVPMEAVVPGHRWVKPSEYRPASGSGSRFSPGDTLFARITPCLENGKIAQYAGERPGMGSTEFFVLRARKTKSDPTYVYYFALNRRLRSVAEKSMSGASGRQRASLAALADFACKFPPLSRQQHIAAALSSFDELLENDLRRIALSEEIARSIFRQWFVEFRFPGSESATLMSSPIGKIPKDWVLRSMSECVEIDPRIFVARDVTKPFVPMASLSEHSMLISNYELRSGSNGSKFQNDDTLFARITPCLENGKTGFVQFLPDDDAVAVGSTEFIVLRSRTLTPEFVYCLARSEGVRNSAIKSMTGASGRQRVQEKCFDRIQIAHPPRALLEKFSSVVVPMFRLIHGLHERVDTIRKVRDLVLPRLIGVDQVDLQAKPGSRG
jgi:type I restriction enzyme S subunit